VMALVYLWRNKLIESVISIGLCSMFLTTELFQFVYPALVGQSPVVLAENIIDKDSKTILYKGYDPAFLFNYQRTFPFVDSKEKVLEFLKENPEGTVITKEKFYDSDWKEAPVIKFFFGNN